MSIGAELKKLCPKNGEIEVLEYNVNEKEVIVLLPYESNSITLQLNGETVDELIHSFKEEVNLKLDRMIDHLNDCKFDV